VDCDRLDSGNTGGWVIHSCIGDVLSKDKYYFTLYAKGRTESGHNINIPHELKKRHAQIY
jgi:hypothetical protein